MKKKIAIVVTNLAGSGAEKVALSQAKLFKRNGYETVLFLLENVQNHDVSDCDFPIVALTKRKDTYKFLGKSGDHIYAQLLQAKMKQFGGFDIVISNLPRADRVVKELDHPNKYFIIHISYLAELRKFSAFRAKRKLKLYQYLYEGENIITVSQGIIEDFDQLEIAYKSATTIYNLFDFQEIRAKAEETIDFQFHFDFILAPSAFREQKRYDVLLDAFSQVKSDVKLLILANQNPKLHQMIVERGIEERVMVLGFQKNPYPFMKHAKLTVMSSDYEGFGMVIAESLILGTPVVSTDCPTGPNEILTGSLSRWLVPVGESGKLAEKIDEALCTEIEIDDSHINKFEQETVLHEYEKLFLQEPTRQKSVAVVVTNLASSGAEKIALMQAKLFKEHGHRVVLFLVDNIKEYETHECDFPIETLTNGKNTYKVLGKVGDRIYAEILEKKMERYGRFDIVISNLPRADRVVKLLNHPNKYFVIHTSYKTELEKFAYRRGQKKSKLYQYLYADENIITVAKAIIDDFDKLKIPYKKALTIYNPFSFEEIRQKGREKIELDFDYIISPTAFRKEKRYDIMLDALKMLRHNIKLVILANRDSRLETMIKERGLEERVVILGFQQNPYKYISKAKLLVLSSEREGLPTVMIESLILGTPVVATNCPTGPSEILTGSLNRWLVPVENSEALTAKIDEALQSSIEINDDMLDKFNKKTIYEQFKKLF